MTQSLIPNPDPTVSFPPPPQPVDAYFPLVRSDPPADTFEIGLVLGGTVSAAAYTAGVIDFLIQALDAWTLEKNTIGADVPGHKVRIKIATGTSGGAIMCVLLSRVLGYAFPPCDAQTTAAQRKLNPFYDCWVNQIDMVDLLQLTDIARTNQVGSLLCADKLDQVGLSIAAYKGQQLGTNGTPAVRDYFEQLLPIVLTLTNLRGIPYSSDFRGNSGRSEYYTDYADHMRFLADITGKNPPTAADLKPYETGISEMATAPALPWDVIIHAARGSSAFPVGLPPQIMARDLEHYRYRYTAIEGANGSEAVWLRPAWPYMTPVGGSVTSPYQFLAVDGGCFNNEPTSFAHQWLAGVLGRNPRGAADSHRAVVLVDPFADAPDYGLAADNGLLSSAMGTLSAWKTGARYETADLDLFTAEDVFSRFLVNPVRKDSGGVTRTGGDAIATDNLAAFGGFLSVYFREHDYMLGRRNCQQFLRTSFVLSKDNSLFDRWTADQRSKYGNDAPGFLPIVPLMDPLRTEIAQPTWPKGKFSPASIHDLLEKRLEKVVSLSANKVVGKVSWPGSWLLDLAIDKVRDTGTDKIIAAITTALQKADLL